MRNHLNKVVAFACYGGVLLASPVFGAEAGHNGHGEHNLGAQLLTLAFFAINFVLFIYVLRRYALGFVRQRLRQRRDTIVQALEEARRAQEEAENLRQEYEAKLAHLEEEEERLRAQAFEAAERQRNQSLEEARRLAERIQAEARVIAQREAEEARRILRQEVAERAGQIAAALLRENITDSDHRRFVHQFVVEVNNAGINSR